MLNNINACMEVAAAMTGMLEFSAKIPPVLRKLLNPLEPELIHIPACPLEPPLPQPYGRRTYGHCGGDVVEAQSVASCPHHPYPGLSSYRRAMADIEQLVLELVQVLQ